LGKTSKTYVDWSKDDSDDSDSGDIENQKGRKGHSFNQGYQPLGPRYETATDRFREGIKSSLSRPQGLGYRALDNSSSASDRTLTENSQDSLDRSRSSRTSQRHFMDDPTAVGSYNWEERDTRSSKKKSKLVRGAHIFNSG